MANRGHNVPRITKDSIIDVANMFTVLKNSKLLCPKKRAVINPDFSGGPMPVGGVKANMFIDGALVNVRAADAHSFTQKMYEKMLCMYAIGTIDTSGMDKITHLGVYFARYGVLDMVPVPGNDAADTITGWLDAYFESQQNDSAYTL